MSIINHTYGFIFIHVPKAAGTTITAELSKLTHYRDLEIGGTEFGEAIQPMYAKRFGIRKHSTVSEIIKAIGQDSYSSFYSFSFVRHPISRALSTYHFLQKWSGSGDFQKTVLQYTSFDEFVLSDMWEKTPGPDGILMPQVTWLTLPSSPNKLNVSFVGKVETMVGDLKQISNNLSLPLFEDGPVDAFEIRNSSGAYNRTVNLNQRVQERIYNRYKLDYELFNYSPSNSSTHDIAR